MAEIDDYTSGRILTHIKRALFLLRWVRIPIVGPFVRRALIAGIAPFAPRVEDKSEAATYSRSDNVCRWATLLLRASSRIGVH